ncbi:MULTISPECIES: hypothetical protein [Methylobacterium]|uniref:Uncharacterized protein n=1 Tax=Methylobacterium thuringiense TaxID=1003091 RepID=A0ABQ4TSI3_9HYPH|nr:MULTISPECIES: hypothetical protein [Methylobacterium]TXN20127.1 hypothetical protein FV217_19055 [Methylobacterium sp. WL9]GJE56585.1 hypothetical protein EKPJFOCH_3093 [Methylobacterium thuringiense]
MNHDALKRETDAALAAEARAHRPSLRSDGSVSDGVRHEQARVFRMNGGIEKVGDRAGQTRSVGLRQG